MRGPGALQGEVADAGVDKEAQAVGDRAIRHNELIDAVWETTHLSDGVVAQAILTARHALGDSGKTQRFIKTLRGFGYRWGGPVELDLTGWLLEEARGISDDGTVIVGSGSNPDGETEAWRATGLMPVPVTELSHQLSTGCSTMRGTDPGHRAGGIV